MPKRKDINSILIIGAGPIVIGQACEFDYSGTQACKALKEEGYRVILVNSNPATIMTDPDIADSIYIEPINWQIIEKIIDEFPDNAFNRMVWRVTESLLNIRVHADVPFSYFMKYFLFHRKKQIR